MEDTPRERQENELAVLQSMFLDDCVLRRTTEGEEESTDDSDDDNTTEAEEAAEKEASKQRLSLSDLLPEEPICYRLHLRPQISSTGGETHASIDLDVELPNSYPNCAPRLRLLNAKGVPKDKVAEQEANLKELTSDRTGEEVVYTIVQDIQTWLTEFNRPQLSFYDQMLADKQHRKRLVEEEEARLFQEEREEVERREELKSQQIREHLNRREEEIKRLRELRNSLESPVSDLKVRKSVSISDNVKTLLFSTIDDSSPASTPPTQRWAQKSESPLAGNVNETGLRSTSIGNFDDVTVGRCLGRSLDMGCTTHVALNAHGEVVCLCKWTLNCRASGKRSEAAASFPPGVSRRLKQVYSIEQELEKLQALSHGNLVHYYGMRHWQDQMTPDFVHVDVMKAYAGGGSLASHLGSMTSNVFQGELLHSCCFQLLDAVKYLHEHNIVHREVQLTNVFLDDCGKIRLSDYSIMRRLGDLFRSVVPPEVESPAVPPNPPSFDPVPSKKGDVFRMGLSLLALAQGDAAFEYGGVFPHSSTVSPVFKDFIERCLESDDWLRPSAKELVQHPYFSKDASQAPNALLLTRSGNPSPPAVGSPGFYHDPLPNFSSVQRSRLMTEFDYVEMLGSGGFGDVFKVVNKLDKCAYAIKRIRLEKRHSPFNHKISREVKLLSRLNHENVVRYFNSWIETQTDDQNPWGLPLTNKADDEDDVSGSYDDDDDDIDDLTYQQSSSSTSSGGGGKGCSRAPGSTRQSADMSDSYDDSYNASDHSAAAGSIEDIFNMSFSDDDDAAVPSYKSDTDDSIIFDGGTKEDDVKEEYDVDGDIQFADDGDSPDAHMPKFLYIQMEYCEQSTLRDVIDKQSLHKDTSRVWRYFRELVDGIAHIHESGMIHRDLKPPNVFLDSCDRIKIGDFGLATTHSHSLRQNSFFVQGMSMTTGNGALSPTEESSASGNMTSRVGTASYIAPELSKTPIYSPKVDIYSLGIIFFEMWNPPVVTAMERMKILSGLRSEEIVFPCSFNEATMESQVLLVRWMLKHKPHDRPSARELQQSDFLPLAMEDKEMKEVLRHTMASTNSTRYRDLMASLFAQPVDPVVDFTYDLDLHKGSATTVASLHHTDVQERLTKVFRRHGAVIVSTPQLTPYLSKTNPESVVCLMDRHGGLVTLQHDLRSSFARSVARNGIQHLKRFMIGKVFRDKKVRGAHPMEIYECAFDIVTPTPGLLLSDAEVIYSVFEVIQEFDHLQSAGHTLHLNHTSLAQAVLRHCSVPPKQFADVFAILVDVSSGRIRWMAAHVKLSQLSMSELAISTLFQFIYPMEVEKAKEKCSTMKREKGSTAILIDSGLHEVETIITHLHTFGIKAQIMFDFGIVHNMHMFSGVMFRVQPLSLRRQRRSNVLAAGGRYDKLLGSLSPSSQNVATSAVGVSIAVDPIVNGYRDREHERDEMSSGLCEVLVTSLGRDLLLSDRITLVRDLWSAGISADIHTSHDTPSLEEYCRTMGITFLLILKDHYMLESGMVKVRVVEKDRTTQDKMVPMSDLIDFILARRSVRESADSTSTSRVSQCSSCNEGPSSVSSSGPNSGAQSVNITVIPAESGKLPTHIKRKYQTQALVKVTPIAHKLGVRPPMELLAVELPKAVLQDMRSCLDLSSEEDEFVEASQNLRTQHSRYRKYITKICDNIHELVYVKKISVVFLYSCKDEYCEVLF